MTINKSDPHSGLAASECLCGGGLVILPCDTIYGIVGLVPDSEERIRQVKRRAPSKPFIVLLGSVDQAVRYARQEIPEALLSLWPGPITLIVAAHSGPDRAIRVPDDAFLLEILRRTGPVYSTSVNETEKDPLWRIDDIVEQFGSAVELVIDGGDMPSKLPSTILDIRSMPYRLVRQGACPVPTNIPVSGCD